MYGVMYGSLFPCVHLLPPIYFVSFPEGRDYLYIPSIPIAIHIVLCTCFLNEEIHDTGLPK